MAAELRRPPQGFGGAMHNGALCCLRTARPRLPFGGEWRRTYVQLRDGPEAHGGWWATTSLIPWTLCNAHGHIPFPAFRVCWIVAVFFDVVRTHVVEAVVPSSVFLSVPVPRPSFQAAGPRQGLKSRVLEKQSRAWDNTLMHRPLGLPVDPISERGVCNLLARGQLEEE